MKRVFLFVAVMLFVSAWTSSARAQFGMGGFGGLHDPNAEIDQQRSTIKSRLGNYSKPPTSHSRVARQKLSNPASTDAYGRMDLAGHPVPGYPSVRGDLTGSNCAPSFQGRRQRSRSSGPSSSSMTSVEVSGSTRDTHRCRRG